MTDRDPLTIARAVIDLVAELADVLDKTNETFDPLAENNGKVIRDVEMVGGEEADVAILAGPDHLLADWGHGLMSMLPSKAIEFTTDDRKTRYFRYANSWGWTAKNLNEDDA